MAFEQDLKAYLGVVFTKDPTNTAEVATALCQHLGNPDLQTATNVARSLQGPHSILVDGLPVSRSGIQAVLQLREKYTSISLGLTPEDLCDPRVTLTA